MQDDGTPQVKPRHFEKFSMAAPGPVSDRQDHPYAHQAKYDPSGAFLFIPDLGADLVRLYSVAGSEPVHATDIQLPAGSGPRHVDFVQAPGAAPHDPATHAYVICELSNTVEVFALTYSSDLISLTTAHVQSVPTAIDGPPAGLTGAASELAILRQQNVLVAGNRWKDNGEVPAVQTDHAAFYTICANGTLTPLRMEDLAVRNARMFEADPTGTMLAVAGQESGEVVVFQIDGWKELARTALKQVGAVRWFAPRA
jgi:6-phosphogluconolactonase (cycloisomerase 2 family)